MMAVTHIIFAVFLSLIFTRDPVFLAVAAASSLLPDIDDSRSFIGRIFIFSHIVRRIAGHRTITHSFLFALLVSLITLPLGVKVALAVFLGMASHDLVDSLGNSGAALFYPFRKRKIKLGSIDTGSAGETLFGFLCIVGILALLFVKVLRDL